MASKLARRNPINVDQKRLDRVVRELRTIVIGGTVGIMYRVGEHIVVEVFGGDIKRALSPKGSKGVSIRSLAERAEEFGLTATAVHRAVPLYLQVRELGHGLAERISVSHHRLLLPVRTTDLKRHLAQECADKNWTVAQLRDQIAKKQPPHAGGREPYPTVQSLVEALHRPFEAEDLLDHLEAGTDRIDQAQAKQLLGKVNQIRAHLERVEKLLVRLNIQRAR